MNRSESKYFNTAEKMNDALLRLLEKKDFEYITIKELCEEAKVNRSTFYLHYENVGDLLEETTRRLLDRFLSYFTVELENINSGFADCEPGKLNFITEEYMRPYLSYIRDYRSTFSVALKNNHTFGFEQIYDRMFDNIFNPILERFGYPKKEAWSVALRACAEWLDINQDYDLDIYFTVIDDDVFSMGETMLKDIAKEFDSK